MARVTSKRTVGDGGMSSGVGSRKPAAGREGVRIEEVRGAISPTLPPIVDRRASEVTDEDIRRCAYYLSLARQRLGIEGSEAGDWAQAERELRATATEQASDGEALVGGAAGGAAALPHG